MSRRNWAFDLALAVGVGLWGQLEAWLGVGSTHRQGPLWAQALLYGLTALLLVPRRVWPLTCLTAMTALSVVEFAAVGSPEGFAVSAAPTIAAYTVANRLPWRRSWIGLVLSVISSVAWAALDPMNPNLSEKLGSLVWLSIAVAAWLLGALVRLARLNAEERRVVVEQRAARAVAEERNQIARELHDVVGHSISVMTVQAGAVRRRLTPEQAVERQALETIESVGREALAEMRRMVGALRRTGAEADLAPAPGLADLDRLAEKFRTAGLPVTVTVTGRPRRLPTGVDLTAYRLVQEALTNTLRHAEDPHQASVAVHYGPERLELTVRDDGRASTTAQDEAGSGLLGMRERVGVYGGSLAATVHPEGGFELTATLPLDQA